LIDSPAAVRVSRVAAEHLDHSVTDFVTRVSGRSFGLSEEPPLRVTLASLGEADHVLVLAMHHIACDARSIEVIVREIGELYAHRPLPALPVRFADFAVWEQNWLRSEQAAAQLEFWQDRLRGAVPLELPTDRPRSADRDTTGAAVDFLVPAPLARALVDIGRGEAATPFMTMLAVFTALLAEHTGQRDIVLGTTVTGRPLAAVENVVGPFMNSLVLRTDLTDCRTFVDVLRRVRDSSLAAFANQDLPFERVVDKIRPNRDPARNPLFQVLFELEPYSGGEFRLGDLATEPVQVSRRVAKLDLTLHLDMQRDGSYAGSVEYATALFTEQTAQGLAAGFLDMVERATTGTPQLIVDLGPDRVQQPVEYVVAADEYEATRTPAERALADIWADVLDLERVGRQDNFFELGGHSLLAIEVQVRIQEEFDIDLPLRTLFEHPILRALALLLERAVHEGNASACDAIRTEGGRQ
jgi:acyl carrier protein